MTTNITTRTAKGGRLSIQEMDDNFINLKTTADNAAPKNNPSFTGTVTGITKDMVGLGNVDNTSDLDKPISTATQSALNLKSDIIPDGKYIEVNTSETLLIAPLNNFATLSIFGITEAYKKFISYATGFSNTVNYTPTNQADAVIGPFNVTSSSGKGTDAKVNLVHLPLFLAEAYDAATYNNATWCVLIDENYGSLIGNGYQEGDTLTIVDTNTNWQGLVSFNFKADTGYLGDYNYIGIYNKASVKSLRINEYTGNTILTLSDNSERIVKNNTAIKNSTLYETSLMSFGGIINELLYTQNIQILDENTNFTQDFKTAMSVFKVYNSLNIQPSAFHESELKSIFISELNKTIQGIGPFDVRPYGSVYNGVGAQVYFGYFDDTWFPMVIDDETYGVTTISGGNDYKQGDRFQVKSILKGSNQGEYITLSYIGRACTTDLNYIERVNVTGISYVPSTNKLEIATLTSGNLSLSTNLDSNLATVASSGSYNDLIDKPSIGTSAAKDVATTGDASATEVVLGNDSRLTDARIASDVYEWAKATTKPSYTATEVGAADASHNHTLSIGDGTNNKISYDTHERLDIVGSGSVSIAYDDVNNKITISGSEADTLQTVTTNGATSDKAIKLSNATISSSTSTGALVVSGGVGIGGSTNIGGDLTVTGNLIVNGTTSTINSSTITVDDKNIELGSVTSPTNATADGGGITLKGATDKSFNWSNATSAWESSEHLGLAAGKDLFLRGLTSGTITLAATDVAGTNTITLPAATGTVALTSNINAGSLTLGIGAAGATNTTVTVGTGTGFHANTSSIVTYDIKVGPALTALATTMTGATTGIIKKTGADTYALDTNTYLVADDIASLIGRDQNQVPLNQYLGQLAYQNKDQFAVLPQATVTPQTNGELTFQLTSDSLLEVKVKGSDGTVRSSGLSLATTATGYQPLDNDLTAIAGLTGPSGYLKKTAADTWTLDTNAYLTTNQSITVSGDATGAGTTSIALTLANSGATAGTYNNSATAITPYTIDSKGRITATGSAVTITPAWSSITGKPTSLSGYGITDAIKATNLSVSTTTATATALTTDGLASSASNQLVIPADSTVMFKASIVARNTNNDSDSKCWEVKGAIRRGATTSTTALIGNATTDIIASDGSAWSVSISADTTNGLLTINGIGEAGKTIQWGCVITTTTVIA